MQRTLVSLAVGLVTGLSAFAADAPAGSPANALTLPARIVAPTDTAQFRRLVLDNGMRVLLVSDAKFNKSAASLVVNVGQIDDPQDTEGLAHFLEHMLFLGTEKYPDITDYSNFIRANGGYNNAYTTSDHTNYQFEVRHDAFAGALDRFAQFFIAPLFTPEFVGREVSAVNNEAMRHLQNDQRRQIGVLREMYAPGSGESKFSTGNKQTLAGATPAAVRAFYEAYYTSDRMALALTGKASLDELEKLAREKFSAVPKRAAKSLVREAAYIPLKDALRMAQIEPVKEIRKLAMEFLIPATRPDFASKPDQLVTQLISYPGAGGLVDLLKKEGLANDLSAYVWERTGSYGSLFVDIDLTPAGQAQHQRVLQLAFSYLEHLRTAPFPSDFYAERARVGQLAETYSDRGEGAALATKLSNQALFYPLEVAERATTVWGKPDEAAYRRVLDALRPNRMLSTLAAKGLPTDRKERIYSTPYSVSEQTGAAFDALAKPAKVASFALPKTNPFMPASTDLLAERAQTLINEPALKLAYLQDTEFQRPSTALVVRFVPLRSQATADKLALLRLLDLSVEDAITAAQGEAALAGVAFNTDASAEGYRFRVSGFGDSPARYADHFAAQLRNFTLTPQRFEAVKEVALRRIASYAQTEAYLLASHRRDAMVREFQYLPNERVEATKNATLAQVQAFAKQYFAKGRLEVLVHGNLLPEEAAAVTRKIAKSVGAQAAPDSALVKRRHLVVQPGENVLDAGAIEGANSALILDYLLPDESAKLRAASMVLSAYFSTPFYSEMRTRQQLGYIVASAAGASLRERYLTFIIQSSDYGPGELRKRAETFIATLPASMAKIGDDEWATLVAGVRANLEQKPKSIGEKADLLAALAYDYDGEWTRRQSALAALASLTRAEAVDLLTQTLAGADTPRRTVMLTSAKHAAEAVTPATFSDRSAFKAKRQFK